MFERTSKIFDEFENVTWKRGGFARNDNTEGAMGGEGGGRGEQEGKQNDRETGWNEG